MSREEFREIEATELSGATSEMLKTSELERAVIREVLRQWTRDRFTLDGPCLTACDALLAHVKDARVYLREQ